MAFTKPLFPFQDVTKPTPKHIRQAVTRKYTVDNWKTPTLRAATTDKTQGFDGNQVTQFGLKLRSRSDDYIPLFEEYEE